MILFIFGTTGELIKLAPVMRRTRERALPCFVATTAQQATQISPFLEQFGLPEPDLWLARGSRGKDLATNRDIPRWLGDVGRSFLRNRPTLRTTLTSSGGRGMVIVHGDTMTSVLGALMGRSLRARVGHIEAGLRSYSLREPFPEEINRRITSRLATTHFAPGLWAASHLRHGDVVDTQWNTVRDSLDLVPEGWPPAIELPSGRFGIVSLHRYELLQSEDLLTHTMRVLAEASRATPLLFVDHSVTAAALRRHQLDDLFDDTHFRRIPRLRFFDFVQVERRAAFVVTDSGGSQEECYYLDVPCLVHRRRTERQEGLGQTSVLSGLDTSEVRRFLADPARYKRDAPLPPASPSTVIVNHLEAILR